MTDDPIRKSQELMRVALPKRFYKAVSLAEENGLHALRLDGRGAKTPGRNALAVPTRALGEALAAEWDAVGEVIDPANMPLTRLVNAILDGVLPDPSPVARDMLRYAASDLLCYRAEEPEALIAQQEEAFGPVLAYANNRWGADFAVTGGIMPVSQTEETIAAFAKALPHNGWTLGAMHVVMTLTGSAILALALADGAFTAESVWAAAHVDEDYQAAIWGRDAEAEARRARRKLDFEAAALVLAQGSGA